jgi:hypothetical protein
MDKYRLAAAILLVIQITIVIMSIGFIVDGDETILSYFNIVLNVVFGALNVKTIFN